MHNQTQLDRYKKLLDFLDKNFREEEVNIKKIEEISFYSYRNINRIFLALQHETIGQFIKRTKLETAAEYIKYSDETLANIAFAVGYSDLAAFSKAFKKHFRCSPSNFRNTQELKDHITLAAISQSTIDQKPSLNFEIEELPEFGVLYLTYQGSYDNTSGIQKTFEQLIEYALKNSLLDDDTIVLGEVLDDNEITETIHCRYNSAIILNETIPFSPKGLFKVKTIESQKYAKFVHKGSHESCTETYDKIYAHWMTDVQLEFEDMPTLEFFLNDEEDTPPEELLTEIYIPVK